MASRPQIVPSKHALQALRKLALGGSTVVGAVGSVSGLACVSYDIRQRIHLAESIVETKRILHSQPISNPNRKAHMAAIFDMYEKGESKEGNESWQDFNRRTQRKSSRHAFDGNHSGSVDVAAVQEPGNLVSSRRSLTASEVVPEDLRDGIDNSAQVSMTSSLNPDQTTIVSAKLVSQQASQNTSAARKIIEATQQPHKVGSHTVYSRPRDTGDSLLVQKLISATQRQHKLASDAVFGRPAKSEDETFPALASSVQQWLTPSARDQAGTMGGGLAKRPGVLRKKARSYGTLRPYSALAIKLRDAGDITAAWASDADVPYYDPFFQNWNDSSDTGMLSRSPGPQALQRPDVDNIFSDTNSRGIPVNTQQKVDGGKQQTAQETQQQLISLLKSALWKPERAVEEVYDISASPISPTATGSSLTDQSLDNMPESVEKVTSFENHSPSMILEQLCTVIHGIGLSAGVEASRDFTLKAMDIYARGGRPDDCRALDRLHRDWAARRRLPFHQPVFVLIHYLMNTGLEEDHDRAVGLLFRYDIDKVPCLDRSRTIIENEYGRRALSYVQWLCSSPATTSKIVQQFRKVIGAFYVRDAPNEAIFQPILRLFLDRGKLIYLRNMFEEMKYSHSINPGVFTRGILLLGYAKANDWALVASEFETMHKEGLSRSQVISYALMFDTVLHEHALSEPINKTHDFLIHAVNAWGLVPITTVSATAIQAYLRHRRYDLIKDWNGFMRYKFPSISNTGNFLIYTLAQTWKELETNCEEIEDTVFSTIRGTDNIVAGRFSAIVQEALANDLARKLHAINTSGKEDSVENAQSTEKAGQLSLQLELAFATIRKAADEKGFIKESSVADLLVQSRAALRMRKILGAKDDIVAPDVKIAPQLEHGSPGQSLRYIGRGQRKRKTTAVPIPQRLRSEHLPDRRTLLTLVANCYSQQLKLGERVNHEILNVVSRQLSRTRRREDVLHLFAQTFRGPAVQGPNGVMFDIENLQYWMEAAYHLKSISACKLILDSILEKGSAIWLTHQFMLLATMAVNKAVGPKHSDDTNHRPDEVVDLDHLLSQLKDRFFRQRKNPAAKRGRKDYSGLLRVRKKIVNEVGNVEFDTKVLC